MKMNAVFIYKHPETTSQAKLDNSKIQKWWTINDSTICRLINGCSLPTYQKSNRLWVGHVTSIKRMWLNISFCHIKNWKHHRTLTAITTTYDPVEDHPDNVQKQTWQILLREQTFLRASNSYLKSSWGVTGVWVSRKWRINVKENETKVHWINITWRKR